LARNNGHDAKRKPNSNEDSALDNGNHTTDLEKRGYNSSLLANLLGGAEDLAIHFFKIRGAFIGPGQ